MPRNNYGDDNYQTVGCLISVIATIFSIFGIVGPRIFFGAAAILVVAGAVIFVIKHNIDMATTERLIKEPCKHGTKGGMRDARICPHCQDEKRMREQDLARKNEEARILAERERQMKWENYKQEMRLPEFLRTMPPDQFEQLVCCLFQRLGYIVEQTPYSGDNGSDGFLTKDGEKAVLQCKRVKGKVGEPVLRDLFGTMHSTYCTSAVVVTTGNVSEQARRWAKGKPIRLIELPELKKLIDQYFIESDIVPSDFDPALRSFMPEKPLRYPTRYPFRKKRRR